MKQFYVLIAFALLPLAGFSQAEKGYTPQYNPLSPEPYKPPKPEEIPVGYRYIKPLITTMINVDSTNSPSTTFALYPNPSKDFVELHWDWFAEGLNDALTLSIYSIEGKLLDNEVENDFAKNVWLLNTNMLLWGMYVVEIRNAASQVIFTEKLSIVK